MALSRLGGSITDRSRRAMDRLRAADESELDAPTVGGAGEKSPGFETLRQEDTAAIHWSRPARQLQRGGKSAGRFLHRPSADDPNGNRQTAGGHGDGIGRRR